MPIDDPQNIDPPALTWQVPLHFKRHNFDAFCYDVTGCTGAYNSHYQIRKTEDELSPPKPTGDDTKA